MTARTRALVIWIVVAAVALGSLPASATPSDGATATQGGATMETTVTVTEDAEIETVELVWKLDAQSYAALYQVATEEGYGTVAEWFAEEQVLPAENSYEDYGEAVDREGEVGHAIEVAFTEVDRESLENTTVREDGDAVTLEWGDLTNPAGETGIGGTTYVVEMPGEITESNADAVDGSVATWELEEDSPDALTVSSGTDGTAAADSGASERIPGFGVAAAVCGALAAGAMLGRRG